MLVVESLLLCFLADITIKTKKLISIVKLCYFLMIQLSYFFISFLLLLMNFFIQKHKILHTAVRFNFDYLITQLILTPLVHKFSSLFYQQLFKPISFCLYFLLIIYDIQFFLEYLKRVKKLFFLLSI